MAGGMHDKGVCVVGGHVWQERRPRQRTVCILLECILVCRNVHTGRRQGQGLGPILSYCASLVPYTGPGSIECE